MTSNADIAQRNKDRLREFDDLVAKRNAKSIAQNTSGPRLVSEEHAALIQLGKEGRL